MPETYTQIITHAVFAVKYRENIITKDWCDSLHHFMSGIITNKGATSLAVGGWKDHVHIFFGMPFNACIADFINAVKANSSKWINHQHYLKRKFQWQEGYGAFSYANSQRDIVVKNIMNQEELHRTRTFKEEYIKMLNDLGIDYDDKNLFEFFD